jgi:replicative DNA helicase
MSHSTFHARRHQAEQAWQWARPPQEPDAEQAVLSACLHNHTALVTVAAALEADDFVRPAHQLIWPTMLALHGQGAPVDPIVLGHRLRRDGLLHRAWGHGYPAQLAG